MNRIWLYLVEKTDCIFISKIFQSVSSILNDRANFAFTIGYVKKKVYPKQWSIILKMLNMKSLKILTVKIECYLFIKNIEKK